RQSPLCGERRWPVGRQRHRALGRSVQRGPAARPRAEVGRHALDENEAMEMHRFFALLCLACMTSPAHAQSLKDQVVGTWTLVSNYAERADGTRLQTFGKDPKGIAVYDGNGRFAYIIMGDVRKKFGANNRMEGSDEEN